MEIWGRRKGRVSLCQYVKRTSQKHGRDKEYIYFFCHRSFDSRTTNNVRNLN